MVRALPKYPLKKYPTVGACGLNCGLCPRYYTDGPSRCPGCCGPDFWQKMPGCGFITCCVKQRNLETCAKCGDWAGCQRLARLLDSAKHRDSFLSHRPIAANLAFIQKNGIEEFARREVEKQVFLKGLIDNYNEGRSKSFYCTSCQLVPLGKLREAMEAAQKKMAQDSDIKEKARLTREAISNMADSLKIDLKLRK